MMMAAEYDKISCPSLCLKLCRASICVDAVPRARHRSLHHAYDRKFMRVARR
jgi:hypothetical protein